MQTHIELTPENHDCLLEHALHGSSAHTALAKKAVNIRDYITASFMVIINCDKNDAQAILRIAKKYCPNATSSIEASIRESEPTHS